MKIAILYMHEGLPETARKETWHSVVPHKHKMRKGKIQTLRALNEYSSLRVCNFYKENFKEGTFS